MCNIVNRNRKSDKTVTNLDLMTKDNVTRDSFKKKTYKTLSLYCGFISYKQDDDITDSDSRVMI